MDVLLINGWLPGLLLLAAEAAVEGAEEPGGLFAFDATLLVQILQFLLLLLALNLFFFQPIQRVVEERSDYIRSNASSAQKRFEEAQHLATQYERDLQATRLEAQQVVATAESEAQKIRAQRLAEAQREATARTDRARAELETQKQAALKSLEGEVENLSRTISAKLLGNSRNGRF